MKVSIFLLIFSLAAFDGFSQKGNKVDDGRDYTIVSYYHNYISVRNYDGTRSSIILKGPGVSLIDSEGRRSNVVRYGDYSTLLASDGTILMVMRNNTLSTLFRADDSKVVINHNSTTSSCSTKERVHIIRHVYAAVCELSYTWPIDILLHQNWLMKTQPIEGQSKVNIGDIQNLMSNKEGSMTLDDLFNAQE